MVLVFNKPAIILVFYRLNSAIERGTKPDKLGRKPCHWTSTLKSAMVKARRAWKYAQPRCITVVSANLLHGFGQFNLRTLTTRAFAALPALVEARAADDRAACAIRSARVRAQRRPTVSQGLRCIVGVLPRQAL